MGLPEIFQRFYRDSAEWDSVRGLDVGICGIDTFIHNIYIYTYNYILLFLLLLLLFYIYIYIIYIFILYYIFFDINNSYIHELTRTMDGLMIYMEIFPTGLGVLSKKMSTSKKCQPSSAALAFNSVTPCPLATPTSELSRGVSIVVHTGL